MDLISNFYINKFNNIILIKLNEISFKLFMFTKIYINNIYIS